MKKMENFLVDVPYDKNFWVHDGQVIKNLNELVTALESMSDETFSYHVNKEKNDFSNWVSDVIRDKTLARELKRRKSKKATIKVLKERIEKLNKLRK